MVFEPRVWLQSLLFPLYLGRVRSGRLPVLKKDDRVITMRRSRAAQEKQDNCGVLKGRTRERSVEFPHRGFLWVDYKFWETLDLPRSYQLHLAQPNHISKTQKKE